MAKRVRSRSTYRPGGQGPSRSKKTADDSSSAPEDVSQATTDADIDSAIEATGTESSEIAVAPPAVKTSKRRARRQAKTRTDDLTAKALAEDVWVRADLRRIGIVSVILFVALGLAWVVFVAMDVLSLY